MIKKGIRIILMSMLVFCSISFLTIFNHLASPINKVTGYKPIEIGFPFKYYEEFIIDCPKLNYGWNSKNLVFDIILTLIIVSGIFYFRNKEKVIN